MEHPTDQPTARQQQMVDLLGQYRTAAAAARSYTEAYEADPDDLDDESRAADPATAQVFATLAQAAATALVALASLESR